jgi:hypothetical protein
VVGATSSGSCWGHQLHLQHGLVRVQDFLYDHRRICDWAVRPSERAVPSIRLVVGRWALAVLAHDGPAGGQGHGLAEGAGVQLQLVLPGPMAMQNHPGTQAQIWDGNTWVPLLVT